MASSTKKALLSTSELARKTGLHRETVRERLQKGNVAPKEKKAREKLYDPDEALAALQTDERSGLRKAQTAKTAAEAARAKLKLDKERGELVPIQDVREDVQELVKRIYQHFAVTSPPDIAPQLRGQKAPQIAATLRRDAERFFRELRAEFDGYLNAED